jgi:hypothetical protein
MWRGFIPALVRYGLDVCDAWEARGHADATRAAMLEFTGGRVPPGAAELRAAGRLPPWVGSQPMHVSHRSSLLRKDPAYYRRFFPTEPDDLPYVWPPAAFPRWPVRRGRHDPVPLSTALAMLGHTEPLPEQAMAVAAVLDGQDAEVALPPGGGATTTGLLAGLCTPGTTLWVSPPHPDPAPEAPEPESPVRRAGLTGKVSAPIVKPPMAKPPITKPPITKPPITKPPIAKPPITKPPIAKPPTAADLAAMAAEADADPEFYFLAADRADPRVVPGLGLVVLDGVRRADVPAVRGVPVLTLRAGKSG